MELYIPSYHGLVPILAIMMGRFVKLINPIVSGFYGRQGTGRFDLQLA